MACHACRLQCTQPMVLTSTLSLTSILTLGLALRNNIHWALSLKITEMGSREHFSDP